MACTASKTLQVQKMQQYKMPVLSTSELLWAFASDLLAFHSFFMSTYDLRAC